MYCSKCGKQIAEGSRFCPNCGSVAGVSAAESGVKPSTGQGTRDQTVQGDIVCPGNPPKSPHHAWWGLLWPGIGHIVLGQKSKGVTLMVITFVINLLLPVINLILIPLAVIDAYKVGNRLAAGRLVRKWDWFPS